MHPGKVTLAIALMLAGCGGNETGGDEGSSGSPAMDETCENEPQAAVYTAGMSMVGEQGVTVALLDADPAPPQYGDNTWTLEVKNAAGEPLIGATVTLDPIMVAHGHGPPVNAEVTDNQDGTYVASPVHFNMLGLWATGISIEAEGQPTDTVSFAFCIE